MSATQYETLIIIPGWSDGPANNSPDQTDRQSLNEIAMNLDRSWTRSVLLPGFSEPQIIGDITHHVFHIPPDPERHSMLFWGRAKYMVFTHQSLTISFGTCIHEISLVIPRAILDQNHWSFEYLFGRLLMFCGQIEKDTDLEPFRELKEQKEYCWRVKIEHWGQAALISPKNAGIILERFGEQWESCPEPDEGLLTQASYEAEMKELTWATDPDSKHNKLTQSIQEGWAELKSGWKDIRQGGQESIKIRNQTRQETYQSLQRTNQILDDLLAKQGNALIQHPIAHNAAQGSGKQVESTVYHITHRYRYDKPFDTCFKSDRPLLEMKETLYYLMDVAAIMLEEDLCGPLKYDDLSSESICFLLQEYYGFELFPYQDDAVEIDLYYLWSLMRMCRGPILKGN